MRYILITIITFLATLANTQEVLFIECWAGVAKADCEDINKCIDFPDPYELSCDDLNKFSDCINELVDHPDLNDTQLTESQVDAFVANNGYLTDIDIERCTGDFENGTNRTGWWSAWTPITQNANIPRTEGDWANVSVARTSPNCITDMTVNLDFGNHYLLSRRNRARLWADYRLVINGTPVWTKTYHKYRYKDTRNDTSPDIVRSVQENIIPFGSGHGYRLNVPAGATVQVQVRERYQVTSSQSDSYFRYIPGLRSEANFSFNPRDEITGVVANQIQETQYWILEEDQGVTYGVDEPIEGATIFINEKEYQSAVKLAEEKSGNQIDEFQSEIDKMISDADDKFSEIRNLTAKQIASNYTLKENKVWAKLLGLKNYSMLNEPFLSQLIFEALNK